MLFGTCDEIGDAGLDSFNDLPAALARHAYEYGVKALSAKFFALQVLGLGHAVGVHHQGIAVP